jgi:hypothetical protein
MPTGEPVLQSIVLLKNNHQKILQKTQALRQGFRDKKAAHHSSSLTNHQKFLAGINHRLPSKPKSLK